MTQDRIEKLEVMIAHQERQIQDLSDMLGLQGKEIDTLKIRLDRTQKKIVDMEMAPGETQGEALSPTEQALRDKPPHY